MSDKLFSSEGNPIWFTPPLFLSWGACLYRAMFHLNIKACEEVARHFKWHFLGFSQGMWPLKCPRRRDLITETMPPLWRQGDSNLYLSAPCSVDGDKPFDFPCCSSFRLHTLDTIWEIARIFSSVNQQGMMINMPLTCAAFTVDCAEETHQTVPEIFGIKGALWSFLLNK